MRQEGEKAVGVESEGERRGGRTRGYSVHARLEAGPAAMAGEMREVEGTTEAGLVGRAQAEEKREEVRGGTVQNV